MGLRGKPEVVLVGLPAALLLELIFYGIHLVLFCICAYILIKRRQLAQLIILAAVTIMMALSTVDIVVSFRVMLQDLPAFFKQDIDAHTILRRLYLKRPLFVTNNFISDGLLLYRCYMIWGRNAYIILGSTALLVADTVWGYVSIGTSILFFTPVFLWSVFAFNLVMTSATAGRIWWIARAASPILEKRIIQRYYTAIAIIIESGAIYSLALLVSLVVPLGPYMAVFEAIDIRVVGIIPTLMVVQVEFGRNHEKTDIESHPLGTARAPTRTYGIYLTRDADRDKDSVATGDLKNSETDGSAEALYK